MVLSQTASTLLLVRPSCFGFNSETADSNSFQNDTSAINTQLLAEKEFASVVKLLNRESVTAIVIDDEATKKTPDAIFPNNWVSFHENGKVIIYPMEAASRRRERRQDIIEKVCEHAGVRPSVTDLTAFEKKGHYLEGTGSVVFDHLNRKAYMALSSRSHRDPLEALSEELQYTTHIFETRDYTGKPVYHTNVMMSIGNRFAVVCDAVIPDKGSRFELLAVLERTGRQLVTIDGNQMNAFAGNVLEIKNEKGDPFILLSQQALGAFTSLQKKTLENFASLLPVSIPTIEHTGGGSVRCMVAEVFLRKGKEEKVQIKSPVTSAEFEACYHLRWSVLRAPWNQPTGSERDDQESISQHFMAVLPSGKIIATARLQDKQPGIAQLRYMAVDPGYHNRGIGKQMLDYIEKAAFQSGYSTIFLQARENAVPFYRTRNYSLIEKTFLLYDEIQHYSMRKELVSQQL